MSHGMFCFVLYIFAYTTHAYVWAINRQHSPQTNRMLLIPFIIAACLFIFLLCCHLCLLTIGLEPNLIRIKISDPYKQSYPGYPPQQAQGYPQGGYAQPGYPQPGPVQPGFMPVPGAVPYGHVPSPPNQHAPYSDNSSADPIVKGFDFTEETIRRGFIRKVYSILTCQLAVTLGFIFFFGYHDGARQWATNHMELFWLALIVVFVTIITITCCEGVRRTSPHNFIALSLFTLAESYMVAMSTLRFSRDDVSTHTHTHTRLPGSSSGCDDVKLNCTRFIAGITSRRCDYCRMSRSDHLRLPNQMGLHNDGRHSVCRRIAAHVVRAHIHVHAEQDCHPHLLMLWGSAFRYLFDL